MDLAIGGDMGAENLNAEGWPNDGSNLKSANGLVLVVVVVVVPLVEARGWPLPMNCAALGSPLLALDDACALLDDALLPDAGTPFQVDDRTSSDSLELLLEDD